MIIPTSSRYIEETLVLGPDTCTSGTASASAGATGAGAPVAATGPTKGQLKPGKFEFDNIGGCPIKIYDIGKFQQKLKVFQNIIWRFPKNRDPKWMIYHGNS